MQDHLFSALTSFTKKQRFGGKGALSIALVVTQHAKQAGLPLDPNKLLTPAGTQVAGASGQAIRAILQRHGISRTLASEGGRTSRGSVENMREYVAFLNAQASSAPVDLDAIESFWIQKVELFFAAKPFRLRIDSANGLRPLVRDLLQQAADRQRTMGGMQLVGAVLQHLVGAKLECALAPGTVQHHGFSTADAQTGRAGDFVIADVAIHITTAPTEALIGRCRSNLDAGIRPLLVTMQRSLALAEGLASNAGVLDRMDIFEVEQFIALNLYELGRFAEEGRKTAVRDLVRTYNEIVEANETDPGLMIELL